MAVKLKFKLLGRRHRPFYRLAAMDSRTRRDGPVLEELGTYEPTNKDAAGQVKLNLERIQHWLSVGAQPTPTVRNLLVRQGIAVK
jgi:small subunit ribosomal protein S16